MEGEWKEGYRKSRREETVLSRLRIGHTNITHSYLLKTRTNPPWREGCHAPFSVEHILIECIDLVPKRQQYYTANNIKDLFEHIKVDIILKFLKAVGLYRKNLKAAAITFVLYICIYICMYVGVYACISVC